MSVRPVKAAKVFIDTNVLVYAYDRSDPLKQKQALMVLGEFFAMVTRKILSHLSIWAAARSRWAVAPYICYAGGVKRTTVFLPDDVHEQLRRDAFRAKTSMAELIRMRLRGPASRPRRHAPAQDPILKVAGVCRGPILSSGIDDSLYGD
jgi:hypothetical protein